MLRKLFLRKKILTHTLWLVPLGLVFSSLVANAAGWSIFSLGGIATAAISTLVGFLVYIAIYVASVFLYFEAAAVGAILKLSSSLTTSPVVRVGFPIVLSLANLALLCGLIVIGVMTILRNQGYGAKNTLWKLIVIAIAINFGLVVSNVILGFSDSISSYFLSSVSTSQTVPAPSKEDGFVAALTAAFQPQNLIGISKEDVEIDNSKALTASLIQPIAAGVIAVFTMMALVITMGILVFALLVRYIKIGLRLVFLPLSWAAWVFPKTQHFFSKWWSDFIQQVFFAPIVLFFLWLTIRVSVEINSNDGILTPAQNFGSGTTVFQIIMVGALQSWILVSISIAGIMTAQSLGVAGASAGMDMFKKGVDKTKNFALDRTRRGATATGSFMLNRRFGGQNTVAERIRGRVERTQRTGVGRFLTQKTGVAAAVKSMSELAANTSKGAEAKKHWEEVDKLSAEQAKRELLTATGTRRDAVLMKLVKEGEAEGHHMDEVFSSKFKDRWASMEQGKGIYKKGVEQATLMTSEMYALHKEGRHDEAAEKQRELLNGMTKEDAKNINMRIVNKDKSMLNKMLDSEGQVMEGLTEIHRKATLENLAELEGVASKILPTVFGKVAAKDQDEFSREMKEAINGSKKLSDTEKKKRSQQVDKAMGDAGMPDEEKEQSPIIDPTTNKPAGSGGGSGAGITLDTRMPPPSQRK